MNRYFLAILLFLHVGLVMMLIGAAVLDTYVLFPNWFHHIPESLSVAKAFFTVHNPGAFFIPMLLLVILSGGAFTAAGWWTEPARVYVLVAVVLFVAIGILNVGFIYPRIGTFFGDPLTNGDVDLLTRTAQEFQVLLQVRMVIGLIAAGCSVFALWRFTANAPQPVVAAPTPAPAAAEEE